MKLDKIKFAKVVSWVSRMTNGLEFAEDDLRELDDIVDMPIPDAPKSSCADVDSLLSELSLGAKIPAIKAYRVLTGAGLLESKNAVEKYWGNSPDAKLLARIRQALGTTADGDELVDVAKAAYRNGEELASHHNFDNEPATLGDIL